MEPNKNKLNTGENEEGGIEEKKSYIVKFLQIDYAAKVEEILELDPEKLHPNLQRIQGEIREAVDLGNYTEPLVETFVLTEKDHNREKANEQVTKYLKRAA